VINQEIKPNPFATIIAKTFFHVNNRDKYNMKISFYNILFCKPSGNQVWTQREEKSG